MVTTKMNKLEEELVFSEKDILSTDGTKANVYKVNGKYVGKIGKSICEESPRASVLKNDSRAREKLEKESNQTNYFYKNGINFPQPYGVFEILNQETGDFFPGFVMDKLNPEYRMDKLKNTKYWERAKELKEKEIEKVELLGYVPRDSEDLLNGFYNPEEDKFYFIDCADWITREKYNKLKGS